MHPSAQAFAADNCSDLLVFPLDMNNAPFVIDSVFISLSLIKGAYHHAEGDFLREKERIRRKIVVWFTVRSAHGPLFGRAVARTAVNRRASTILCYSEPVRIPGVGIPRVRGTAKRQALPPAFMRGEGHAVAGGVPRRSGESLLSHGFAVPAPPEGKPRALRTVLAPAFMRGEGHAVAGGVSPPQRGRPSQSRRSP